MKSIKGVLKILGILFGLFILAVWLGSSPSKDEAAASAAASAQSEKVKNIDGEVLGYDVAGDKVPGAGYDDRKKVCHKLDKSQRDACENASVELDTLANAILRMGSYSNVQNDPDGGVFDIQHPGSSDAESDRLKLVLAGKFNQWNAKYKK
jgi:hypothetical protein